MATRLDPTKATAAEINADLIARGVLTEADLRGETGTEVSIDGPLAPYVWIDPQRLGGDPCFRGTRVPLYVLFDHLAGDLDLDGFFKGWPYISREACTAVIDAAFQGLLAQLPKP